MTERKTTYVIITWIDEDSEIVSLSEEAFLRARQNWVDEGHCNLQTEWYEHIEENAGPPHQFRVFAYWRTAATTPSIEQLKALGKSAINLDITD